jgi:hypothetical protein
MHEQAEVAGTATTEFWDAELDTDSGDSIAFSGTEGPYRVGLRRKDEYGYEPEPGFPQRRRGDAFQVMHPDGYGTIGTIDTQTRG